MIDSLPLDLFSDDESNPPGEPSRSSEIDGESGVDACPLCGRAIGEGMTICPHCAPAVASAAAGSPSEPPLTGDSGRDADGVATATIEDADRGLCQWCGAPLRDSDGDKLCDTCGSRISVREAPAPAPVDCQWCGAPIQPGVTICPACGGTARGDPTKRIPGLTELTDAQAVAGFSFSRSRHIATTRHEFDGYVDLAAWVVRTLFGRR